MVQPLERTGPYRFGNSEAESPHCLLQIIFAACDQVVFSCMEIQVPDPRSVGKIRNDGVFRQVRAGDAEKNRRVIRVETGEDQRMFPRLEFLLNQGDDFLRFEAVPRVIRQRDIVVPSASEQGIACIRTRVYQKCRAEDLQDQRQGF